VDRLLYLAMTGAHETMRAQSLVSNNLANATTTGFRADLETVRSLPMQGPVQPSRVYGVIEGNGLDLRAGELTRTGRALDVAVEGDGWIAVQAPDGGEAYTRAGDLKVNGLGLLTTGAGHPVMGDGGPIAIPPHAHLEIGADGTISVQPLGQSAKALAVVDRIKLVKIPPGQATKGADGLIRLRGGGEAEADASVRLVSGALEASNVSPVESMVRMIELARQYETQIKMMKTAEENDRSASSLLRLS